MGFELASHVPFPVGLHTENQPFRVVLVDEFVDKVLVEEI
jgi:hypothetical protein